MLKSQLCRSILPTADSNIVQFQCDCFVQVFLGHALANKICIESRKKPIVKICDPDLRIAENELFCQMIFHWFSQSENCITFSLKT